ncbi:MAG: trypsin-like serine protease [Pseudomonadota bacterium]
MLKTLIAVLAAFLAATGALAQSSSGLKALVTANDSKGWEAVGRLDIGQSGFCTGALIDDRIVLTAAHCLYNPATLGRISVDEVEFLAGWRNGRASAYRKIRRAVVHPEYVYTGPDSGEGVPYDLALLELDQPIRNGSISPYATDAWPRKGDTVGVVSYAHNRAARPALQEACQVLARPSRTLVLTCDVDFGSSGAPIFSITDGEPRIVSVVSAKAEMRGRKVSLGADVAGSIDLLRASLDLGRGALNPPQPTVRRLTIEPNRGGGAKFLRP